MSDRVEQQKLARSGMRFALRAGFVATALTCFSFWYAFSFYPFENDDASYLFQATLYLLGRLSTEPPPVSEFNITFFNLVVEKGRLYSQYPYGHPIALAMGLAIGMPWIVPVVSTGAVVVLIYLISDLIFGRAVAKLAAILAALSPAIVGMGSTYFSETTSRFMLGVFVLFLLRLFYRRGELDPHPSWLGSLIGGVALGFAFNTRPMTAAAFGVAAAIYVFLMLVRLKRRAIPIFGSLLIMALGTVGMIESYLAYNKAITGNPFDSPYPFTGIGFDADYTVHHAIQRAWRTTLPNVTYHLSGLGALSDDPYKDLLPYSTVFLGGVLRAAPGEKPDCDLTVWGMDNGFAQIHFNNGPRRVIGMALPQVAHGRGTVELGLSWNATSCSGRYRLGPDEPWVPVAEVATPAAEQLEAGVYSGLLNDSGSGEITFESVRFEEHGQQKVLSFLEPDAGWIWKNADGRMVNSDGQLKLSNVSRLGFEPGIEVGRQVTRRVSKEGSLEATVHLNFVWLGRLRNFFFQNPAPWLLVSTVVVFVLVVLAFGFTGSGRLLDSLFLVSLFLASLFAYSFVKWDFWAGCILPPRTRYLNEATVLGILPIYANGLVRLWNRCRSLLGPHAERSVLRCVIILWGLNISYSQLRMASIYESWGLPGKFVPPIQDLVRDAGIKDGVILVNGPGRSALPLGDYPFEPLSSAQLVYIWYPSEPWESFVARYFPIEKAIYLWKDGELRRLR